LLQALTRKTQLSNNHAAEADGAFDTSIPGTIDDSNLRRSLVNGNKKKQLQSYWQQSLTIKNFTK
jgi:hypothetical protein